MVDRAKVVREVLGDAALIDVGAWQVVLASGADRLAFLHRLLTNRIEGLAPGQGQPALLLTVKAQIVFELRLLVRADDVVILVPPGQGELAVSTLGRYAIMDDVALSLEPTHAVLAVHGARPAAALATAGLPPPPLAAPLEHAAVAVDGAQVTVVRSPGFGADGYWVVGGAGVIAALDGRLVAGGVARLAEEPAEALRILAGEPRTGREITGDVFPMEVGLDPLIDYGKGCYLGQEPIVRVRDRGHVNWRLVGLELDADGPVAPGDRLETDTRPKAGRVTSAARLPGQGARMVALALAHVSVPDGAEVRVRREDAVLPARIVKLGAATGA